MTIGYIVLVIVLGLIGVGISFMISAAVASYGYGNFNKAVIIGLLITALVVVLLLVGGSWYFNNTAEGARALKEQQSNLNNGLNREITIIAADGREVFHYKGKCDIETDHEDNYILFEGEDGLRRMIYYGVTDTVLILEVGE